MEKKITVMKLKVDLQCQKCYKKVKKVLCKFSQIRDQIYDEKKNMVTIKVVCCYPEMLRDKLCCKGGGSIKSIELLEPPIEPKKPEPKAEPRPKTRPPPPDEEPELDNDDDDDDDDTSPPPSPHAASKFPKLPPPITVLAYPPPAPTTPVGYYERPIYDSYGGDGSRYYVSHYEFDQNLNAENELGCTII